MPHGVGGVGDDGGAPLLAVVTEGGEHTPLPRVDGHLQVGVRVEEHPLFQTRGPEIWHNKRQRLATCYPRGTGGRGGEL